MIQLLLLILLLLFVYKNKQKFSGEGDKNILGTELEVCSTDPTTGWYRNGYCNFDGKDPGTHSVCATMTKDFLDYTASKGNDLSSVVNPNDKWCICANRYKQALEAGKDPPVIKEATHEITKKYVDII